MAEHYRYQPNSRKDIELEKIDKERASASAILAAPWRGKNHLKEKLRVEKGLSVRLNLEELKCFEMVEKQFQHCGVLFANTMAISPSNPAFPPHSGNIVLIGAPKSGYLEAIFSKPVRCVSGLVTSSRKAVLAAYDQDDKPVGHAEMSGANLAGSESAIRPNYLLSLRAENIHRVNFLTFDGHLTVDDFTFSF
ncbi:hypothetical protein [Ancylothrix sp. D3o]|uniref:hypothetical protein n=1 Tax=Ancylothrix sp. D3o TaxID=2953691 RepID=UPI0021BA7AB2|nr:hypothetical protein [Ancylothrix sp. D3o]